MKRMIPDYILKQVEMPARYTGGEYNMIKKDLKDIDIRFALCFPDIYEIGMSHLGMQILYGLFNERKDTYCERVFSPWTDLEDFMRSNKIPMFSLETQTSLQEFDMIGFTLLYEMCYTNMLNILELSNIPLYSKDRREEDPLIIAGGICVNNPEPIADFVDIFYIGDGEVKYDEIFDLYKEHKKSGKTKIEFLEKVSKIEGIYVPMFYDIVYNDDGTIKSVDTNNEKVKKEVKRVFVKDLDNSYYPLKPIVPFIETVQNRIVLEVFRGCIRGCRFCNAGHVYRPIRQKSVEVLKKQFNELLDNTGFDEVSLVSLSTSDYKGLFDIANYILENYRDDKIKLSLPSLRIDDFSVDLMKRLQGEKKKSSLTFAPEAGTQRMRDIINKGITEEDILDGCKKAFEGGWNKIKLYFMMGLPNETDEDILGIAELTDKIVEVYNNVSKINRTPNLNINISVSCFVPKHNTPFQWESQNTYEEFMRKQMLLKDRLKGNKKVKFNYHDSKLSVLEGVMSRGDRKISQVIYNAFKNGARFDSWSEKFSNDIWIKAFEEAGVDMRFYNYRKRGYDEILPWDHINIGVNKQFYIRSNDLSKQGKLLKNCKEKCSGCGNWNMKCEL